MAHAHARRLVGGIIRDIGHECANRGQDVAETLAAFMVKAVVLDPRSGFDVGRSLTQQDARRLTQVGARLGQGGSATNKTLFPALQLCVEKLVDEGSPALDTIKMQVYFDLNYTSRREFSEEHQRVLQARMASVSREITDRRVKSQADMEALHRKIAQYVMLCSGLGSASDINTVKEVMAALQSVFPLSELRSFMSLDKKDQEQQLKELTLIVTGICLFNKDSGKGGEGIDDVPSLLNEAIPATVGEIEKELDATRTLAWQYTAAVQRLAEPGAGGAGCPVHPDLMKQALYNVRQHEAFLRVLLADVISCAKQVESQQTNFSTRMNLLRSIVHTRTSVPISQVFPHFTALASLWCGLQEEKVLLSSLSYMVAKLRTFLTKLHLQPQALLETVLEGMEVKSDTDRLRECSGDQIDPSEFKSQEWFVPETPADSEKLQLQYKGACCYSLVENDGLFVYGNPNIGVLKHKEKYYAFSSKAAALAFASKPDQYIAQIVERARRSPELIQLLELQQHFVSVIPYSASGEGLLVKPFLKSDAGTQTDTHLVESNIVKSYEWNEWELRRKAIQMANLRKKVTRSAQTNLSHMRRDNATQTYLPKDAACQTKKDSSSNVPNPLIYLAGLRGKPGPTNMIKIDLTRPVDE
ncbi:cilia- and flagella-associated protein 206-like isoform X2 [Denticeps clupeoides]|uniref:cilia- and flagella-associated protein 206-like isoform X2 n=1 Tax=Denticeps clupeoides TaxID=299321 RepID=UPI0010A3762F|nr:cilia- and flagella-associated protein 206-like isoform X2 [Denticeps clupeoides]